MKKITEKIKEEKGFVILFAVTISAILLSIALGVANIAQKEIRFGTSAKASNDAFYAADTGIECALINDKSTSNSFVSSGGSGTVACLGGNIALSGAYPSFSFVVNGTGSSSQSCANVTVFKDTTTSPPSIITTVTSKGYNIGSGACTATNPDRVERVIILTY